MSYTIVYKTYENDIKWLYYSLLSVNKYVIDVDEIIIYYHNNCENNLKKMLETVNLKIPYKLISVVYDYHGYLKQMVVKLMSFIDIKTDYVVFIDSDVIFDKIYSPNIKKINDKLIWNICVKDENNKNECQWNVWEKSVINMTKSPMNIYFMANGFPFVIKKQTLIDCYNKFIELHNEDYNSFCKKHTLLQNIITTDTVLNVFTRCSSIFEEFEYLGWYAYNFTTDYIFINDQSKNTNNFKQYWSHGGISDNINQEILKILE
jgi:hypothetical protein